MKYATYKIEIDVFFPLFGKVELMLLKFQKGNTFLELLSGYSVDHLFVFIAAAADLTYFLLFLH